VFASAFGQDQEFFEFYRSMQAYRTALSGQGTTMLLSPDSEFFSYFNAAVPAGGAPAPAAPGGIAPLPSSSLSVPLTEDVTVETDLTNSPALDDAAVEPPAVTADPIENTGTPAPAESSVQPTSSQPPPAQ
jgi:membrane protease subunit HflC